MAATTNEIRERLGAWLLVSVIALLAGCSTPGLVLSAVGVATDTSVTWEVVKHVHAKLTEGDGVPCARLDSVQRALNARCGEFVPGSLRAADLHASALQGCALEVAAAEPRFWGVLPELLANGASAAACANSPLVMLAQRPGCPDFRAASPAVLAALRRLADTDARAVDHDVVRLLSCPAAAAAGLDTVLTGWLARNVLDADRLPFGMFGALHPGYLGMPLVAALEARGHTARRAFRGHLGTQPGSFELALRGSDWRALEWWLARAPELANRVPAAQGNQLPWVPLARALTPGFVLHGEGRAEMVAFLLARGADPWQRLPFDAGRTVVQYARSLRSPHLALLDPPPPAAPVYAATLAPRPAE